MQFVKPKKHLGQHFLRDEGIAAQIVGALQLTGGARQVLEVGPGMGVLTKYLVTDERFQTTVVDIDTESISWLRRHFPVLANGHILEADFLRLDLSVALPGPLVVIGNFPYNISTQIYFHVLHHRAQVTEVVGMLQREVAERLAAPPGTRETGVLGVLLHAFYDVELLFRVPASVFQPPPKVESAVIRCVRNGRERLECDEKRFLQVVKQAFSTRRKTLRNALKPLGLPPEITDGVLFDQRAEQLSVADFEHLTRLVEAIVR
ncbi:MAG: ribosomal RNA small subunit methyltransferase A [Hymenobacteraceae bacterium]|nr:ribosomal RNA small subunit methyltransferase A [Hymenobacteraceae bacterium]